MPTHRFNPSATPRRTRFAAARAVVAAIALTAASSPRADEFGDVQSLYRSGRSDAAMLRVDDFLHRNPQDPQMRFLKGVMLADAKRHDEAADIFRKLTEDHPDLAEPYNNLAAIYAAAGDYPKARATLELAVRANPGYATAYENLGDVYVAMAGQSYGRALQLAPNTTSLAPKLVLTRELLQPKTDAASLATAPASPRVTPLSLTEPLP